MSSKRRRSLRWILWGAVGLILLCSAAYVYLTNPVRLRRQALAALSRLPMGQIDVNEVTFSPALGLQLHGVTVTARHPDGAALDIPPLLRVDRVEMRCAPLALLTGTVRPTAMCLRGVVLTLVCDPGQPGDEWRLMSSEVPADQWRRLVEALESRHPRIDVPRADVRIMVSGPDGPQLFQRWPMSIVGYPTETGYSARAERPSDNTPALAEIRWLREDAALEVSSGWGTLSALRPILPASFGQFVDELGIESRARVDRLTFCLGSEPGGVADCAGAVPGLMTLALTVEDTRLALPIEDDRGPIDASRRRPEDHFLQLTGGRATVTYQCDRADDPGSLVVLADGKLNQSPWHAELAASGDFGRALWRTTTPQRETTTPALSLTQVRRALVCVSGLELPTTESAPKFMRSTRLPHPLRAAFKDYQPAGRVNVELHVNPVTALADASEHDRIELIVESLGCRCRYKHFPYLFENASGRVRVANGKIHLEGLRAQHGATQISAVGEIFSSDSWAGFDLVFRGQNVGLERDLYLALPPEYRQLWARGAPLGVCDVVTHLRRPQGTRESGPRQHDVQVSAALRAGSLLLDDGRRITQADGRINIINGTIQIEDLHGYDGETAVQLSGQLSPEGSDGPNRLRVVVADMPVAHTTVVSRSPDAGPQELRFAGRADVWGAFSGLQAGQPDQHHLAVRVREGTLAGFDPQQLWTDAHGWVVVQGNQQRVESLTCRQGQASLELGGTLPQGADNGDPLVLDLQAAAPALSELVPQFVPDPWQHVAEMLGLAGPGHVNVRLAAGSGEHAPQQTAHVEVQAGTMRARPLPLELRDVDAQLTLSPGQFELHQSSARWGASGVINAQARGSWDESSFDADIALTATGLEFSQELRDALPGPLYQLLEKIDATGEFDAYLPQILYTAGTEPTWRVEGRIPLRQASMDLGLELTEATGVLFGTCTVDSAGNVSVSAEFELDSARVSGRALQDWRGQLTWDPQQRLVVLDDLHGRMCDGDAVANVTIYPDTGTYELSLMLQDVAVDELFPRPDGQEGPPRRGRIDGNVHLQGQTSSANARRGGGDLRILGASLLDTPVLKSVAEAETPNQQHIGDRISQADVRFLWEGDVLTLQRVEIQSEDLRMLGQGTWNLRTDQIEMTLLGAHPRHWARIFPLTDIVEAVGQELVQYHVSGTLSAPDVSAEPLYKLNSTIKALLGAE